MISVLLVNVFVENELRLLRDNMKWKDRDLKMNWRNFLERKAWNKFSQWLM